MPASPSSADKMLDFQLGFILRGGIPLLLDMLTKNLFLSSADTSTQR